MDLSHLRAYHEGAFANQYYDEAVDAFDFIKEEVLHSSASFLRFNVPLVDVISGKRHMAKALALNTLTVEDRFAKLVVLFVSSADAKAANIHGSLNIYGKDYLWMFRFNSLYALILAVDSETETVTAKDVRRAFAKRRSLRHLFVHEFTHYLQQQQWHRVLTPLLERVKGKPDYYEDHDEKEAWLVEHLSRFLHDTPAKVQRELVNDFNAFKREFLRYLNNKSVAANFFLAMTPAQRNKFFKDGFAIVQKRVATPA